MDFSPSSSRPAWTTLVGAILVVLLFGLPLFSGLGNRDLHNDEASYSYGVERILETGNWMTIRGTPDMEFLEKPPLKFWMVAGAMTTGLLPKSDIGMRWLDALMGTIVMLYVYLLGLRLQGPIAGGIAALVLFTFQPLLFDHGLRSDNMEAALTLAYCAGFYHAWRWIDARRPAALHAHAAALAAAFVLGFMTKFIVIAFLPMGALVLLLTHPNRRELLTRARLATLVAPALLAVVLIAPWFIYQTQRIGSTFWEVILGQQVLRRMSSGLDPTHLEPPAFYVTSLWKGFAESQSIWFVMAGLALALAAATRRQGTGGRLVLFWAVVPLAAMSVSHSKLIHYAYPFVPPLALGAGWAAALVVQWIIDKVAPAAATSLNEHQGRWALVLVGVAALLIAGATISLGRVVWHLPIGGAFTNNSVLRPLLLGVVLLYAATRQPRALLLAPLVLALAIVLPLPAYAKAHADMAVVYRPLAAVNTCLRALKTKGATLPTATYLVSGYPPTHAYYYYLREFGPYTERTADHDLDQELRERLTPERLSLLLFKDVDFWNWIARANTSGTRFAALMAENEYVLVLPGASADCAAEGNRYGGKGVARP